MAAGLDEAVSGGRVARRGVAAGRTALSERRSGGAHRSARRCAADGVWRRGRRCRGRRRSGRRGGGVAGGVEAGTARAGGAKARAAVARPVMLGGPGGRW